MIAIEIFLWRDERAVRIEEIDPQEVGSSGRRLLAKNTIDQDQSFMRE